MKLGHGAKERDKQLFGSTAIPLPTPQEQNINAPALQSVIFNQLHTPSCGAHAGTAVAMAKWSVQHGATTFTPEFLWAMMKKDGPDKNPDDGSTMPQIFGALQQYGADDFQPLGNHTDLSNAEYASLTPITPAMYANAQTHLFDNPTYYDPKNIDELATLIDQHGELVILIRVGATMWTDKQGKDSWKESDTQPLRPPQPVVDGHFVKAHSHIIVTDAQYRALQAGEISMADILLKYAPDAAKELGLVSTASPTGKTLLEAAEPRTQRIVLCQNSWSAAYGFRGHLYFGAEYMPYVIETGTIEAKAPVPQPTQSTQPQQVQTPTQSKPAPQPAKPSLLQQILSVIMKLIGLFSNPHPSNGLGKK